MINIFTSLTVPTQPSPRFHVDAWLPFRNCENDYWHHSTFCPTKTENEKHFLLYCNFYDILNKTLSKIAGITTITMRK